jgi:HJR/Mrr/RecB family endonuclease
MTSPDISTAKDPDLRTAMAALMRAGALARKAAMDAGTDLVLVKDGKLVLVEAKMLRRQSQPEAAPAS